MNLRFHVTDAKGKLLETTEWVEENSRDIAVSMVKDLRKLHGQDAAISIERSAVIINPKPKMFRLDITVKSGTVTVVDGEGQRAHDVSGMTLHSRPFQDAEREAVLAEVEEKFPKAIIVERQF